MLVVVANLSNNPGGLGATAHVVGLGEAHRQRFFAIHCLACGDGGHGHGEMQMIGRCDRHDLHLRITDQVLPVSVAVIEAPGASALLGPDAVRIRQGGQSNACRQIKGGIGIAEGQGVARPMKPVPISPMPSCASDVEGFSRMTFSREDCCYAENI